MNFRDLAALLSQQAMLEPHIIRLNDSTLQRTGVSALIKQHLRRADGTLLLTVAPADIPVNPPDTGFSLKATVPPDAKSAFLSLSGRKVTITFAPAGANIGFALDVALTAWTFGLSYPELSGLPFDLFTYSDAKLRFATDAFNSVPAGSAFDAGLQLDGLLQIIADFIAGHGGAAIHISGALTPTDSGLSLDLEADLGVPVLNIGPGPMLSLGGLLLGLEYDASASGMKPSLLMYLQSSVKVTNSNGDHVAIDVRVLIPFTRAMQTLNILVLPHDPPDTSLGNLGSMVAGQSWNDFFNGPAAPLKSYLDTFALKSFALAFAPTGARVISFQVVAGTLKPWRLPVVDVPVSLTISWTYLYGAGSFARFSALFQLSDDLTFDLTVSLPELMITGVEHGESHLTLKQLTDGKLPIPDDLLQVTFGNFNFSIDPSHGSYVIGGTAGFAFKLFGAQILALSNAQIMVNVQTKPKGTADSDKDYTITLNGILSLGSVQFAVEATIGNQADCVITLHLVNETVGSMLNHLVHLVDPNYDISFGEPWDKLLDISLDAFVFELNLTKKTASLTYSPGVNLEFITIDTIKLDYAKSQGKGSSVHVEIDGSFLGQSFGGNSGNAPIKWDALNQSPPSVPGKGTKLFDLDYVGLGQHVALQGPDLTTVEKVMVALRNSVIPIQDGQLPPFGQQGGISFSADSNWLIGAQFTIMDTVAISAIFNDPNLYGILITLSGEKAKIFAGLRFEILYRKVTDSIGVYHIEFTLPDAMRHLEFGEVSITLPVLILDIYTNGNFRVDLGFPVGLDFSNSFSIQVFPFVGFGGFYFALLDGATSSRVPRITNGSFSPVIEFGIALSLGVGKEVDEGILKGGISVTVVGVLQGVLGWFHPTDDAPKDTFYWIQGTISIVGKLYATIDFVIIQASVDVTAYLSVTLTIECYQPILIEAVASVSVRVSVKIIFFTIHFSFSATVDVSFTIGHASTPPWIVAPGGPSSNALRRMMRGQATLFAATPRHARLRKALRRARLAAPPPLTGWPAVSVLPQGVQTVAIWAMPAFTKSETDPNAANAILLLSAENSIHPGAATLSAHRMLHGAAPHAAPFNLLMEAMLRWGIYAETNNASTVTGDQLETLRQQLKYDATLDAAFNYTTLTNFLAKNFVFQIVPAAQQVSAAIAAAPNGAVRTTTTTVITTTAPHGLAAGDAVVVSGVTDQSFCGQFTVTAAPSTTTFSYLQPGLSDASSGNGMANKATGVAVFPMIPEIVLTDTIGTNVSFSTFNTVSGAYQEKVRAYFQLLQVQFQARQNGGGAQLDQTLESGSSIATVVFTRYFNMLMSAGVKAAIDLLAHYPYTTPATMSIGDIGTALNDPTLVADPLRIVSPNQGSDVLNLGAVLALPNVVHQVRLGESFVSVAAALASAGAFNAMSSATIAASNAPVPGAVRRGGRVTITTIAPHGLILGGSVTVAGVADTSFDGTFGVADVPNASTFSYAQAGADGVSGGGSASTAGAPAAYATLDSIGANLDSTGIFNTGTATWTIAASTNVPPGAVRLNGTTNAATTITTTTPHGLVPGSTVTISGVADSSFNGTFMVASVPSATSFTYAQPGLAVANSGGGTAGSAIALRVGGLSYTSQANDTLGVIAMRLLLRIAGPTIFSSIDGLAEAAQALRALNPSITDPNKVIDPKLTYPPAGPVPNVALAGGGSYSLVTGDTLTWVAAYGLAIAQNSLSTTAFLNAVHQLNPTLPTDPTQPLAAGTAITLPPVTRVLNPADTIDNLATTLIAPGAAIQTAIAAVPAGMPLLAPQAVLRAPLRYGIQKTDTFSGIASKFNLTLQDVAGEAVQTAGLFAGDETVIVSDLPSIAVDTLITGLLNQAEWNNASGMVSRFLLSGLRLPDPHDPNFEKLTLADLQNPVNLGGITTAPMYALTGQQYAFAGTAPGNYQITLTNGSGASWLSFTSGVSSLNFGLTADQQGLLGKIVSGQLDPQMQPPVRLSLFQMVPPRIALQDHVAWQAATLPPGTLSASGAATGHPSIWLFPDALVQQVAATANQGSPALYELVAAKHYDPREAVSAEQVGSYAWATIVDVVISLPQTDGNAPSVANCYVINGADDVGADLLQQIYRYLADNTGQNAALYLLYAPSPTSGNASGLSSDQADQQATCLIKANLSTLTHSSHALVAEFVAQDPTDVYAAPLSDTADFTALLWEASITRSGGFYLNYVNHNGGNGFPATVFGNETRATVSLLVVLDAQAANRDAAVLPFNNCVITGENIDTTTTTLFVQPAVYAVQPGDSLALVQAAIKTDWGTTFAVLDIATFNAAVPLLLNVGASLGIPNKPDYQIQYGDTLASIVANPQLNLPNLAALVNASTSGGQKNVDLPILASGALMQFALGVLRPATTVPPGTAGFEITRLNPDPNGVPYPQLDPSALVGALFNLVGFAIEGGKGGFLPSGAGLPTTPADSLQAKSDGLGAPAVSDDVATHWYYRQTLAVGPFGQGSGSASSALPAVEWSPYNGIAVNPQAVNAVTLDLGLQDIYGNRQPLPPQLRSLTVPVGYYDDIVSLGSWPSLAMSYGVTGTPPTLGFNMTMQQARYIPSASVMVATALSAIAADLASYTRIYYQLAQPDIGFALRTSLDTTSMTATQPVYPLGKTPFSSFAYGAYIYLAALAGLQRVQFTVADGQTRLDLLTARYGVTAAEVFNENRNQVYAKLFGTALLNVPQMYSPIQGDSLLSIVNNPKWSSYGLTVAELASRNADVPLAPETDFSAPARTVATALPIAAPTTGAVRASGAVTIVTTGPHGFAAGDAIVVSGVADASFNAATAVATVPDATSLTYLQPGPDASSGNGTVAGDTLNALARRARASVGALALANGTRQDILRPNIFLTVGTKAYHLGKNDSFTSAAQSLGVTVDVLAQANQWVRGLILPGVSLDVADVIAGNGDTLTTLAAVTGQSLKDFVATAGNESIQNLFATGTAIEIGMNPSPTPPLADDTLASFAQTNSVTLEALAGANASAPLGNGAVIDIPATLLNPATSGYCTYRAQSTDHLATIAGKFGAQPADIVALNPDIPGLIAGGQKITDSASGQSVPTQPNDTFDAVIARFAALHVTVTLAQLSADIANQAALLVQGGLWICPAMRGDAYGLNASLSIAGLAQSYNADPSTLALSNAAAIGFLASGQTLTLGGATFTTNGYDTLNSLANRAGGNLTVADVIAAVANVAKLVAPNALVLPVPPPSPPGNAVTITPRFADQVFQIVVNVVTTRNSNWIDPDFAKVTSVAASTYGVPPEADPAQSGQTTFSLTHFAAALQAAIPGLQVATGAAIAERDPASAGTIWGVNFNQSLGPYISYQFNGSNTQYFALPPLSTALMAGSVPIKSYVSGQGLVGDAHQQRFQAVDLDVWLNAFLGAVDLFLSPAYAVPAYAVDPVSTVQVIKGKQTLAAVIKNRLQYVLANQQDAAAGSLAEAKEALHQALLQTLSSAFTVDTIMQVPVAVTSTLPGGQKLTDPKRAPRLSGKIVMSGAQTGLPNAFSFSTAKVSLTDSTSPAPTPTANFLFSVKAPAEHKEAALDLAYVVNELELPDPNAVIGDYQGSSWLKFVLPLEAANSTIGNVDIPVPLRAYPSPVTLMSQIAEQDVAEPKSADDLLKWNFKFVYQHDDAEQDTPLVVTSFNAPVGPQHGLFATPTVDVNAIFETLAQFTSAYAGLKDDLAQLTMLAPGSAAENPSATVAAAVSTFAALVHQMAQAWQPPRFADVFAPPEQTYRYQMQKGQSLDNQLTTLTITSLDDQGRPVAIPAALWPAVYALVDGKFVELKQPEGPVPASQRVYDYPASPPIPADQPLSQYFIFGDNTDTPAPTAANGVQNFEFRNPDIFTWQTGHAAVSISRNLSLIAGSPTNNAFVYCTPLTNFSTTALATVIATDTIPLAPEASAAKALSDFFQQLLSHDQWQKTVTLTVRFAARYSFDVARSAGGRLDLTNLGAEVPILLVPSCDFNPATDGDWTNPASFVAQIENALDAWAGQHAPLPPHGAYLFDLTIYAVQGTSRPLIRAQNLQYELQP